MTGHDWLACADPQAMLNSLRGKASERKVRLYLCACCRRIWPILADERCRAAVEASEDYADGLIGDEQLRAAFIGTQRASYELHPAEVYREDLDEAYSACTFLALPSPYDPASVVDLRAADAVAWRAVPDGGPRNPDAPGDAPTAEWAAVWTTERGAQADLLRDIFGDPSRPVAVDPAWLTWNDGAVAKLARAIYEGRTFDRLPIVADALEEAGCTDAALLAHCRRPGGHVRGCWVVDLLLGKTSDPVWEPPRPETPDW
jgi:hypothetical protein